MPFCHESRWLDRYPFPIQTEESQALFTIATATLSLTVVYANFEIHTPQGYWNAANIATSRRAHALENVLSRFPMEDRCICREIEDGARVSSGLLDLIEFVSNGKQ